MATHIDTNTWTMDWKTSYLALTYSDIQQIKYVYIAYNIVTECKYLRGVIQRLT